jgi:hypothetical protein
MREICTSGSVGALGRQLPRATRRSARDGAPAHLRAVRFSAAGYASHAGRSPAVFELAELPLGRSRGLLEAWQAYRFRRLRDLMISPSRRSSIILGLFGHALRRSRTKFHCQTGIGRSWPNASRRIVRAGVVLVRGVNSVTRCVPCCVARPDEAARHSSGGGTARLWQLHALSTHDNYLIISTIC